MIRISLLRAFTAALCIAAAGMGCGGGGGGGTTTPVAVTVTSVVPGTLMYGAPSTFTVTGTGLDQGISFSAANCSNIAEAAGGTAVQRTYSCTPTATGAMPVAVTAASGSTLASLTPTVPQPRVTLSVVQGTSIQGQVVLELDPAHAPITVNNFLQYVRESFYTNLIFHRVIPNFMIQGGGFNAALVQPATHAAIKLEMPNGLSNLRGTVAMARTSDPNSATSQFFINTVDNQFLDTSGATATQPGGYAVFGKVVSGMNVVDQVGAVATQTVSTMSDVPVTPVFITSAVQTQ